MERLERVLAECLAPQEWSVEPVARARFGCDAFEEASPPEAVLMPASVDALSRVLPAVTVMGCSVVPSGASLSYSAGALPSARPWVAIDLRGLARVLEVNPLDRSVRVEAGATWATLDDALAPTGLRCPFWGPASGRHATVGGTIANDAIFFGSAAHGTAGDGVRGLTVLLADGSRLETGVHLGRSTSSSSLARSLGPDLGRLFVGSCGAFGIIVEATLPLLERPSQLRGAGFSCADSRIATAALAALGREQVASEAIVLGPGEAAGPWSLHLAVESTREDEAVARLLRAVTACESAGAERFGEGVLSAFRQSPFMPPAMLRDPSGRRWVPVHGLLPHSRALQAIDALEVVMREHGGTVAGGGLAHAMTLALVGSDTVLVEVNLYWQDAGNAVLDDYLGPADRERGPSSRLEPVRRLRAALVAALDAVGASHLQIGRLYPWIDRLDPASRAIATGIKRLFDPRGAMNPGVLGLALARNNE